MREPCPGGCGRDLNTSAGYDLCGRCRKKAGERGRQLECALMRGQSSAFPGHEERMRRYIDRAAKNLPLFGG